MQPPTSLRDIPLALFTEFAAPVQPSTEIFPDGGHKTTVQSCFALRAGKNGPHTLIHHDYNDGYGRRHETKLEIYNSPLVASRFNPQSDLYRPSPKMTILFCAEDFDGREPHFTTPWESGKGYWIEEHLKTGYGEGTISYANITSNHDDWEYKFFLDIQARAHELASTIINRGHWQSEWNPEGDYSKRPRYA